MNISSVVLHSNPRKRARVRAALAQLPGVEIHADPDDGRFILTIEDTSGSAPESIFVQLQQIDGVLNASLVYQYCDDTNPQELNS